VQTGNNFNNRTTGNIGEAQAMRYLGIQGFEIVQQNYRNKLGEIDIIAERGGKLHFIEVKYRRTKAYGTGREAVTWAKQKRIHNIATAYLKYHGLYGKVYISFDVVEVQDDKIEHLIGCF